MPPIINFHVLASCVCILSCVWPNICRSQHRITRDWPEIRCSSLSLTYHKNILGSALAHDFKIFKRMSRTISKKYLKDGCLGCLLQ